MSTSSERVMKFTDALEQWFLAGYDPEDLFTLRKAKLLMRINGLLLIMNFLVIIPFHFFSLPLKPILPLGDLFSGTGIAISMLMIKYRKAQTAVTLTAVALISIPFLHNVVGDFLLPSLASPSRYFESLSFIIFTLPLIISLSFKMQHIFLATAMSAVVLLSHFIMLRYMEEVPIEGGMLSYILFLVVLGFLGIINLNLTNEAIASLRESRDRMMEWNKVLERTVEERTKELMESNQKLEAMSQTDGLTGIANRRRFDTHLLAEWNSRRRANDSIGILVLDVDQFKLYNDTFGHQQGDLCLQQIAAKLAELTQRSGELAARYGGEEFAFVLPGIDTAEALQYGEKVRCAVEDLAIKHAETANNAVVTVSVGVAVCRHNAEATPQSCLEAADRALYRAKKFGRNRVELAD